MRERPLRIGAVCSGIGGLEKGLEAAGLGRVAWQVEIDPFCRRVLRKHWPRARQWGDLRTFPGWGAEVMCGGIPCQPYSKAGLQLAAEDPRDLLEPFVQTVDVVRPRVVVLEEVEQFLVHGLGRLLRGFSSIGYDAQWDCIPAAAIGAPHVRDRVFVVAYPNRGGQLDRQPRIFPGETRFPAQFEPVSSRSTMAYADSQGSTQHQGGSAHGFVDRGARVGRDGRPKGRRDLWGPEPAVARVVDGFPGRVDRCKALGNAVVPQVSEYVGRLIVASGVLG